MCTIAQYLEPPDMHLGHRPKGSGTGRPKYPCRWRHGDVLSPSDGPTWKSDWLCFGAAEIDLILILYKSCVQTCSAFRRCIDHHDHLLDAPQSRADLSRLRFMISMPGFVICFTST